MNAREMMLLGGKIAIVMTAMLLHFAHGLVQRPGIPRGHGALNQGQWHGVRAGHGVPGGN